MPLSLKKHVTLPHNQPFHSVAYATLSQDDALLSIVLIVPLSHLPSHSHSKAHSCLLSLILLTHLSYSCSSFLTCSRTLILVAILAFSLHGILSFATLTLRRTLPSTLSSHSPSIHSPLSRRPVRVMPLIRHSCTFSLLEHIKYLSMVIDDPHLVFASRTYTCPRDPQLTCPFSL